MSLSQRAWTGRSPQARNINHCESNHRESSRPSAMSLESKAGPAWLPPLVGRVPAEANAEQLADAIVTVWRDIDLALHPILGHRGVAALYNRNLRLSAAAHPWLAGSQSDVLAAVDVTALRAALLQQPAAEAAAAGTALFRSFEQLLASLVGPALTAQLLQSVWVHPAVSPPAQDNAP
ncbi:MAG: hypothetical protein U5L05_03470 [Rubrivivax sp.]|nr:hypothetical protein [Rubrivivax sp.]